MRYYAVIDLGSNSVRLRITEILPNNNFKLICQLKEYIRLSENMGPEKILKEEPIKRALTALKSFQKTCAKYDDIVINPLATAAVRQAKNQQAFLDLVLAQTGLNFVVISGQQEAYLDFLGVTSTLDISDCLIMDTGGASTELILVQDMQAQELISLPFGSVTLSTDFSLQDKISAANLFSAMTYVEQTLTNLDWLTSAHKMPLVCLGGSNRTLAKVARRKAYAPGILPDLHGYRLSSQEAFDLFKNLLTLNKVKRSQIPGLAKARADVVVGGLIPMMLLLRSCHINEVIFSNHGLREGSLLSYLKQSKN